MTADVYRGDDDLHGGGTARTPATLAIIRVRADADPDMLLRIAAQLNLLNRTPLRFSLQQDADGLLLIEAHIPGCSETSLDLVSRKIDRLTGVYEIERELTLEP